MRKKLPSDYPKPAEPLKPAELLFISDLHLEMHDNPALIAYLQEQYARGARLHYLGDVYNYPVEYNSRHLPPGLYLAGNHDTTGPRVSMVDHFMLYDGTLLIHGHQAERRHQWPVYPLWNRLRGLWEHRRMRHWTVAGAVRRCEAERFGTNMVLSEREKSRILRLAEWIRAQIGECPTVIMGHLHRPFNSENVPELRGALGGMRLLNCGRGWQGEHIIKESDGKLVFCWFEQVRQS